MIIIKFEILKLDEAPEEIKEWFKEHKKEDSFYYTNYNDKTYIIKTLGEKTSGGHSIELVNIFEEESHIKIEYKYIYPSEDEVVTQIINYPYLIMKFNNTNKKINIEVCDEN